MGSTGKTYTIKTMRDFLSVPKGRRAQCLKEFALWMTTADELVPVIDEMRADGILKNDPLEAFQWCDDGNLVAHMKFREPDGKSLTVSVQLDGEGS